MLPSKLRYWLFDVLSIQTMRYVSAVPAQQATGLTRRVYDMFLVSSGVDLVRRGAAAHMQLNPTDPPLQTLVDEFRNKGGTIWVCPPCAEYRGYEPSCFIEGVEVVGSGPLHEKLRGGASSFCL